MASSKKIIKSLRLKIKKIRRSLKASNRKSGKRSKKSRALRKSLKRSQKSLKAHVKFERSKSPKRVRAGYRKIKNSRCASYRKAACGSTDPTCKWVKKRGCASKRGSRTVEEESVQEELFGLPAPSGRVRKPSRR